MLLRTIARTSGMALVCVLSAIVVACGGGGGGGGSMPPVIPGPTPITGVVPSPGTSSTPSVIATPFGSPLPAPAGSEITGLLTGGAAALPYLRLLASAIPLPPPPQGSIAVAGILQSVSNGLLVISTSDASPTLPVLFSTNLTLPAQLSVTFTNATFIGSANGIADLVSGTVVLVSGHLSGSALAATDIVPVTRATLTAGRARKPVSFQLRATTRSIVQAVQTPSSSQSRRIRGTADTQTPTFAVSTGVSLIGGNGTASGSIPLYGCYSLDFSVTFVTGAGTKYTWPMTVAANESVPIPVGTNGIVELNAQGIALPPTTPNFQWADGLAEVVSSSLSCAGRSVQLVSVQAGLALGLNASMPAQLGPQEVLLSNQTLTTSGFGNVTCLELSPIDSLISFSHTLAALQLCPRVRIHDGYVNLGGITASRANVGTNAVQLSPSGSLQVGPTSDANGSFQLSSANAQYFYQQDGGIDAQLVILNQPLPYKTVDFGPRGITAPLVSDSPLLWTMDASQPTSNPTPGPVFASVSSLTFTNVGTTNSQQFTVSETNYSGSFTLSGNNTAVATAQISGKTVTVTPVAAGSTSLTISGGAGKSVTIGISVSSTSTPTPTPTPSPTSTPAHTVSEYTLPNVSSGPLSIAAGGDGALWFTETAGRIGRITSGGAITEFVIPAVSPTTKAPSSITSGPDGALWFTETANPNGNGIGMIGRVSTTGAFTEYTLPTQYGYPIGITSGPDGALWFAESSSAFNAKIGRVTTSGAFTEYSLPNPNNDPHYITAGPDGALWFTEYNKASGGVNGRIGRITTAGVITEFPIPNGSSNPYGIATGSDGAIWFTETAANKIGRITTSGVINEYTVPTANSGPYGITAGPDQALWFSEITSGKIGRVTFSGGFSEFAVLTTVSPQPAGITLGSDGAIWFVEFSGAPGSHGQIGRIAP